MIKLCNKIIEYGFYFLFLLVPLVFTSSTSELFELNKMWLVWGLTIIIAMFWFTKMILERKFFFQKTPLDIPIGIFLLSQTISTIFSLDPHVSLWGYYSRFNGGLLSLLTYVFLYYAFLSNFRTNAVAMVKRSIFLSLICGLVVALWGLPSHFGYDPTCLLFRGTFDVSCWTADFMPKIRIFSTLGQPDWLAAYLAILIPISIAYTILNWPASPNRGEPASPRGENLKVSHWKLWTYLVLVVLFYVDLLFTRARSGFLGIWLALIFFAVLYYWMNGKPKISLTWSKLKSPFVAIIFGLLITTFVIGMPISQLNIFTFPGIRDHFQKIQASKNPPAGGAGKTTAPASPTPAQTLNSGGTESANIRINVWSGAINAWKANPIFGTGVETFAFAYYKYKPAGQNLTSEWNFLYNKAHNEYLNYLATTGIIGLGSYLLMIGVFLFLSIKNLKLKISNLKQIQNHNDQNKNNFGIWNLEFGILTLALLTGYISILVTNFFGFSVVMINVYLFMIPAFVFVLTEQIKSNATPIQVNKAIRIETGASVWQLTPIFLILATGGFMLFSLIRFWQADVAFALGYNFDQAREYQQAYPNLHKAVQLRGSEPVFKDELSVNDAIIAAGLVSQKSQDEKTKQQTLNIASSLAQEAININNEIISQHPNNTVFWKTRTRLFYTLSQVDSRYLPRALDSIEKASLLAPNDANILYNLGVLYGQNNNLEKAIPIMERVVSLKPDYRDVYYALGLFYRTASLDKSGKVVNDQNLNKKAISQMQYILDHLSPNDSGAKQSIKDWTK